jgi:hypothetical protein
MVPSSEKGFVRVGNCLGWVRHACTNAASSEACNPDQGSRAAEPDSSVNAVPNPESAWANTTTTRIPDEFFVAVAKRTIASAECDAADDTIAASDAVQRADSE